MRTHLLQAELSELQPRVTLILSKGTTEAVTSAKHKHWGLEGLNLEEHPRATRTRHWCRRSTSTQITVPSINISYMPYWFHLVLVKWALLYWMGITGRNVSRIPSEMLSKWQFYVASIVGVGVRLDCDMFDGERGTRPRGKDHSSSIYMEVAIFYQY